MAKTTFTATLPNGEILKRTTERTSIKATTFPYFLTVATAPGVRRVMAWNGPNTYYTTSPGAAIRRHLAMFPNESPVTIRPY